MRRRSDRTDYALKKVMLSKLTEKERENAHNEAEILAAVSHPNIIAYKEAFIDEQTQALCIVMEYADNGDLQQKIRAHRQRRTLFSEREIWYTESLLST